MIDDRILVVFLLFFVYCAFGWVWESIYMSVLEKRLQNRGSLHGPYIPIYGFGGVVVYFTLGQMSSSFFSINTLWIFLIGMFSATVLEYITAVIIEKTFHTRLWSYDGYFCNFQGRICLIASLFWGFVSVMFVQIFNPVLITWFGHFSHDTKLIICMFMATTMSLDTALVLSNALGIPEKFEANVEKQNVKWEKIMNQIQSIRK